jgi:hypothetical protein
MTIRTQNAGKDMEKFDLSYMLVEGESVQSPWEIVWKCLALIV